MGLGMGIGAFAEGLAGGLQLGDSIQKSMDERELKGKLRSAEADTRAKYGDDLSDEGYSYMMKKSAAAMAQAGRMDDARKFLAWSEEAETKSSTKQFAAGLKQVDMGDLESFDKTLSKLGAAKGYGPDVGVGFARGDDGKIISNKGADGETYYRLKVTPPGAKEPVMQDVPGSKLKDVYARWFNPQNAYEAERAQAADKSKRAADMTDYEGKKKIDAQYADPERGKKERVEAIDSLRKREAGGKSFDELPEAEKEKAIQGELSLRRGSSSTSTAPAGPSVVMDKATGKPVQAPGLRGATGGQQSAQASAPAGLSSRPATQPSPAAPAPQAGDDIAGLESEAQKLDAQMEQTRVRSRSPEAAEMLLGPMRSARADIDNRIRLAREQRGTASVSQGDAGASQAELSDIDRRLSEIQMRPGGPAAYQGAIDQLQARRGALIEQMNQARRALGVTPASPAAPGLRMGPQ